MERIKSEDIEQEHIKLTKFGCLVLMKKQIFKTMDMTADQLLAIKVNYKKNRYLDNYLKKLFCQEAFFSTHNSFFVKHIVRFLVGHMKFGKSKALKKR